MRQILCFGDSNTWGYDPATKTRYPWGVRWPSLLQERLAGRDIRVLEDGLCGRTTVFDDAARDGRNASKTLPLTLEAQAPLDAAVIMLGTNDCKSFYGADAPQIAAGLSRCVSMLLRVLPPEKILIVSPILLGDGVWEPGFDPEFDRRSVEVSRELPAAFRAVADAAGTAFLAASDYAAPSAADREHMDPQGHAALAGVIYEAIAKML